MMNLQFPDVMRVCNATLADMKSDPMIEKCFCLYCSKMKMFLSIHSMN